MAGVNLFLLLPEMSPSNQWMVATGEAYLNEGALRDFLARLQQKLDGICIEAYEGFHDSRNIINFLNRYHGTDEYYPSAPKNRLRSLIRNMASQDWRENEIQSTDNNYQIFSQAVGDHTFSEMAERKNRQGEDAFALINHDACRLQGSIQVIINDTDQVLIDNLDDSASLPGWFAENRIPARHFRHNPKHGPVERRVGGKVISPLLCCPERAQALLNTAIGLSVKELFNLDTDQDQIIVFKHEGPTPENIYHGYHVDKNSVDVPESIRNRLF